MLSRPSAFEAQNMQASFWYRWRALDHIFPTIPKTDLHILILDYQHLSTLQGRQRLQRPREPLTSMQGHSCF